MRYSSIVRRPRRLAFVGLLALVALLSVGSAACSSGDDDSASATAIPTAIVVGGDSAPRYGGVVVSPPLQRPEFTLHDTAGNTYDFGQETTGSLTLLYFGYTHCPDICPLQMGTIANVLGRLPAEDAAKIKVIFVTTDPKRDTPEVLRAWLDKFAPSFIGLTGTQDEIVAAEQATRVPIATEEPLGNGDYGVAHAAQVIAYTQDNLAHIVYPAGVTQQGWFSDLALLAKDGWQGS